MVDIKSATEIFNSMKQYYGKVQTKVTDLSATSVAGSIIWSLSTQLEELYQSIEEVKRQSYIQTAEGTYLDRLIYGTFGLTRNKDTRAVGYVVLYANSPIQNPEDLRLWCAKYDPSSDELSGESSALKFVTSGSEKDAGRVFVLVSPKGGEISVEDGKSYINTTGKYAQFYVLPVVSMTKGEDVNIPEGSIRVMSTSVPGINGVINTYSPITTFFATPSETPIQDRVTSVSSITDFSMEVVNSYNFSGTGLIGIETYDGRTLKGFYQGRLDNGGGVVVSELIRDIQLEYTDASTRTIELNQEAFSSGIHTFKRLDESGRSIVYTLTDAWFGNRPAVVSAPQSDVLGIIKDATLRRVALLVRQVESEIDKSIIYDPDNVINEQGTIVESARIGGGSSLESDDEYRIKLKKYLASLGRSTPTALEAGALTVPGIVFAKTLPSYMSPRGSATLLVSGDTGSVNSFQIFEMKRTLEEYWKAAGIRLIIKTPQKLEVTAMCRVSLQPGYSEHMVEPEIKFVIRDYFNNKLPGATISYSELTSAILNVPGVSNVWNVYIGKKLTDYGFRMSSKYEGYTRTRANTRVNFGIKFSTVNLMFKNEILRDNLLVISNPDIQLMNLPSNARYKLYKILSTANNTVAEDTALPWNNNGSAAASTSMTLDRISNVQDYEKFLGDYVYKRIRTSPAYEITRHLTEPLDSNDRLQLPLTFDDITMDMMRPYVLDTVEVPVLGTFRTDKEVLPLIGIEFTK